MGGSRDFGVWIELINQPRRSYPAVSRRTAYCSKGNGACKNAESYSDFASYFRFSLQTCMLRIVHGINSHERITTVNAENHNNGLQ